MKAIHFLAAAVLGLGVLFGASSSNAQQAPTSPTCGTPGATGCTPVGGAVCTANGCYQMMCNSAGCDLVFTPRDPFKPGTKEN